MNRIVCVGEILAEFLAAERGQSFREPGSLLGPYPSGAPAIFVDQVARLGHPAALVGRVGNDDFGHLALDRLRGDGVDVDGVQVDGDRATAVSFVRYREDGERDFVFTLADSACAHIDPDEAVRAIPADAGHLHISGSSLFSPSMTDAVRGALRTIERRGGTVSLDPNIRSELLTPSSRAALVALLARCDVFLPSASEVAVLTDAEDEAAAVREILDLGVAAIVVKRGRYGATYIDADREVDSPAFTVEETDPTGAGDCFAAGYLVSWLRGASAEASLRLANACGAHAVTVRGPMEGVSSRADLDAWLAGRSRGSG
jgi:tagatose kinase